MSHHRVSLFEFWTFSLTYKSYSLITILAGKIYRNQSHFLSIRFNDEQTIKKFKILQYFLKYYFAIHRFSLKVQRKYFFYPYSKIKEMKSANIDTHESLLQNHTKK